MSNVAIYKSAGAEFLDDFFSGDDDQLTVNYDYAIALLEQEGVSLSEIIDAFDGDVVVSAGEDVVSADYVELLAEVPALREPVQQLTNGDESPASVASAVEFVLEGLHLSKRLNKESVGSRAQYRGR